MSAHVVNTPGVGGYLLAWLVSYALTVGWFLASLLVDGTTVGEFIFWWLLLLFFVGLYSIPFAAIGLLAVHVLCRRVRMQWVHVLAAGGAGLLPALVFSMQAQESLFLAFGSVAVATALGRLAVVPLVRHRRNSARALATG